MRPLLVGLLLAGCTGRMISPGGGDGGGSVAAIGGGDSSSGGAANGGGSATGGGTGGSGGGAANPCDGVTCRTPPTNVCDSADALRIYEPTGVCGGGQCTYSSRVETCADGCSSGACNNNPCQGITCNTPPANTCVNATTLKVFQSGSCSAGSCTYASTQMTCPYGCMNGACVNDPCAGVTCAQPPASFCADATTLRSFGQSGTCAGGGCVYSPRDTTCPFGCSNGACANDPCAGVSCTTPPARACINASTLRSFAQSGTCSGGACTYAPTDTTCQYGCMNGACVNDPCAGLSCTTPPATTCANATTRRTFSSTGTCSNGACSYTSTDTTCPFGCTNGACNADPCTGVACSTPPAAICASAATLRSYSAPGTCSQGSCSYTSADTTCPYGCSNGACNGDPCAGVSCTTPPAAVCVSASTRRTFTSPGTCAGGGCTYVPVDSTCQYGCASGACNPDPCTTMTCNAPPASTCVGNARRTYSASGTCTNGACSYGYSDTACANGCTNGTCNAPSCGGVTCNTPPAAACTSASNLHTYYPSGTCTGTSCSYQTVDITCSNGCLNGACIAGSWTLESSPYSGGLTHYSVVFDSSGQPVIAGCDSGGSVYVRRLSDQGWKQETVDTGMGAFCEAAVALDANGEPMVAYYDSVNQDLRFALRAGGTWTPKELISNQDNVGAGVSLAVDENGITTASYEYVGPGSMYSEKIASRAAGGTWTEALLRAGTGMRTTLWVAGGQLRVLLAPGIPSLLGIRTGGTWSFTSIPSVTSVLPSSVVFSASGTPSLAMQYSNPNNSHTDWVWRTLSPAWTEESFGSEYPLAIRTTAPKAAFAMRGTAGVIRTLTQGLWTDTITNVPFANMVSTPLAYTGTGGRHVLLDASGRRLSSPPVCTPVCSGRTCGEDGCGGSCGSCASGFCSPFGTCTTLSQQTLPGSQPQYATIGAGATVQVAAQIASPYGTLKYLQRTASGWPLMSDVTGSDQGTLSRRDFLPVDSSDAPVLIGNKTSPLGTYVWRLNTGTWSQAQAGATLNGFVEVDPNNTWHYVECPYNGGVNYKSGPAGAWTTALTTVYPRPSGFDGLSCLSVAANASGAVSVLLTRSFWVSGSNPGDHYDIGVLTNETGSWVYTAIPPVNQTTQPSGLIRYDGTGALHYLGSFGYQVKPAGGTFATEATPSGFTWGYSNQNRLVADRLGVVHLAWFKLNGGSPNDLMLAKRTGPGTWSVDSTQLANGIGGYNTFSTNYLSVAFDSANTPWLVADDASSFRVYTR